MPGAFSYIIRGTPRKIKYTPMYQSFQAVRGGFYTRIGDLGGIHLFSLINLALRLRGKPAAKKGVDSPAPKASVNHSQLTPAQIYLPIPACLPAPVGSSRSHRDLASTTPYPNIPDLIDTINTEHGHSGNYNSILCIRNTSIDSDSSRRWRLELGSHINPHSDPITPSRNEPPKFRKVATGGCPG